MVDLSRFAVHPFEGSAAEPAALKGAAMYAEIVCPLVESASHDHAVAHPAET